MTPMVRAEQLELAIKGLGWQDLIAQ